MCIIIYSEVKPDAALLEECELSNPDGGGIAWRENGQVKFKKGIKSDEILSIIEKTEPPYTIHFRIATVGGTPKTLTHPFPIGGGLELEGSVESVLFHNGHWKDWETRIWQSLPMYALPDGVWSDSRAMAYLSQLYGTNFLNLIDDQKILVFGKDDMRAFGDWTVHQTNQETKAKEIWLSHPLRPLITTTTSYYNDNYTNTVSRRERKRLRRLAKTMGNRYEVKTGETSTTATPINELWKDQDDELPAGMRYSTCGTEYDDDEIEPDDKWTDEDVEVWIRNNYERAGATHHAC